MVNIKEVEKLVIMSLLAMSPGVIKLLPLLWVFGRAVICHIIDVSENEP